ncbi:hypothetical protein [Chitinophaga sp.]|uniref:hypothetical protein n=1 Tax=Chitinophaga sp. TaxID=1869181 RepID=UPI00260AA20E|nr:hypothetical protein [uncultured Chitinophaga sp.]
MMNQEKKNTPPSDLLANILANSLQSSAKHQQQPSGTETRTCTACGAARPEGTDLSTCDFCGAIFFQKP